MKPSGKCIAKKCKDCNFYYSWDMTNNEGLRKQINRCVFLVLSEEIPRIRGSIDGVQGAANESRNRAAETRERVEALGNALIAIEHEKTKLIGSE